MNTACAGDESCRCTNYAGVPTMSDADSHGGVVVAVVAIDGVDAIGVGVVLQPKVTFALPTADTVVGMVVMAGLDPSSSGTFFFIDYKTPPKARADAAGPAESGAEGAWPQTVTVGAMYNLSGSAGPGFSCNGAGVICANDTLQLTPSDTTLTMRAFVDNNLAECYWQTNRVSIM